jgi:CrcB protein
MPVADSPPSTKLSPDKHGWPALALEMAVIAAGGALGAGLRHGLAVSINAAQWHPALATALANLVGSFLLGLLTGHLASTETHRLLRPFLAVGVLGSFTTFSALALDNRLLATESGELMAALQLLASIVSGLAAFILGNHLSVAARRSGHQ